MFCIYLRTNSGLCHLYHKLIGFYNWDKCLLCGTNWVFKWLILNRYKTLFFLNYSDRKQHINFFRLTCTLNKLMQILEYNLSWQLLETRTIIHETCCETFCFNNRSFLLKLTYIRRGYESNNLKVMRQITDQFLCIISTCIIFHRIKFVIYTFKTPVIAMFVNIIKYLIQNFHIY